MTPAYHAARRWKIADLGSDTARVVAQLQTDPARGLSSEEAARRLQQYGPNQLQSEPPVPKWRKFLAQFANPLVLLLLVATVISVAAWVVEGDARPPL